MKQANQLNDQNKKVQLSEMPTEILEHILMHLDGEHLLNASHVCKLFASVAETAFARKYSNKCYQISKKSENSFHKIMLSKYGEKLRRLQIIENDDEDLLDLVEQKCYNLKSITISGVPKMIMLKDLKEASLRGIRNLNRKTFAEFINNNRQLEVLDIRNIKIDLLNILDGRLNMLKSLRYESYTSVARDLPKIMLNHT